MTVKDAETEKTHAAIMAEIGGSKPADFGNGKKVAAFRAQEVHSAIRTVLNNHFQNQAQ